MWEKILKYDEGEVNKIIREIRDDLRTVSNEVKTIEEIITTRAQNLIRGNPDHDVEDLVYNQLQDIEYAAQKIDSNVETLMRMAMRIAEEENDVEE